jgi:hypothetical protein
MMFGSLSPGMCGLNGHQMEVPGTRSNTVSRARVALHMPCKRESAIPIPTPCSMGRMMMAAAVAAISRIRRAIAGKSQRSG